MKAVVNMCHEYGGATEVYRAQGITQLYLPTLDTTCPAPSDLQVWGRRDTRY